MTPPRLSLVIPVYNVARFLPRCLESLAALVPAADEIVVVDDGSTDDCPRILCEFQSQLPQMRVIRQDNGGLSAARNTGLDAASGTFLAFVDSDDFLEPNAYAAPLHLAEQDNLDVVLFNGMYHYEGRQQDRAIYLDTSPTEIIQGKEWLRARLKAGRLHHMVWLHLYRRKFIENNGFRFIPRLLHEDVIWTTKMLLAATRVRYVPHIAINYRLDIRHGTPTARQLRLQTLVSSSVINARTLAELSQLVREDHELYELLSHQLVDGALAVFHLMNRMPDREVARETLSNLRRERFLALLWRHAGDVAQRRRIARHWLRSWFWGIGK